MLSHRKRRSLPPGINHKQQPSTSSARSSHSETPGPVQPAQVSPSHHQEPQHVHTAYTEDHIYQTGMPPQHRIIPADANGGPAYVAQGPPRQFAPILNGGHGPSPTHPSHMGDVITPTGEYQMFDLQPDQIPIWMSEDNLGDAHFSQFGLEAFIVPQQYEPQIW